jgi:hypothetical protein
MLGLVFAAARKAGSLAMLLLRLYSSGSGDLDILQEVAYS